MSFSFSPLLNHCVVTSIMKWTTFFAVNLFVSTYFCTSLCHTVKVWFIFDLFLLKAGQHTSSVNPIRPCFSDGFHCSPSLSLQFNKNEDTWFFFKSLLSQNENTAIILDFSENRFHHMLRNQEPPPETRSLNVRFTLYRLNILSHK